MKDGVSLANDFVEVSLNAKGAIIGLTNRRTGTQFVSAPMGRLWSLVIAEEHGYRTVLSGAQECGMKRNENRIELEYPEVADRGRRSAISVSCALELRGDELHLTAALRNGGGAVLQEFQYPYLGGVDGLERAAKPHWLYWPSGPGMRLANPEGTPERRRMRYPGAAMQWMEYAATDEGLYVASHDSSVQTTFMEATTSGATLYFSYTKHPFLRKGEQWRSADYVISAHEGDWHAGAGKYRSWADTWLRRPAPPAWMGAWTGWFLVIMKQQNGDIMWRYEELPRLLEIARRSGIDTLGLFGWAAGGHDHLYPDYEPDEELGGRAALVRAVKKVQEAGGRIILYTNGHLIDTLGPYFRKKGRAIAARKPDGNHYFEHWRKYSDHPGYLHAVACPSTAEWRERLLALARELHALGADGLLYDQIGGGSGADFCFAEDHGHAKPQEAIGPRIDANLAYIQKEMATVDPEYAVTTENVNDALCRSADMLHGTQAAREGPENLPSLFRYTFPEYPVTNRYGSSSAPFLKPTEANFVFTYGLRTDIECRYPADAECLRTRRRPTDADYACIPTSPDVLMMREAPLEQYEAYLGELNRIRKEHPVLLDGRFQDDRGFAIDNRALTAVSYAGNGETAVVVWNTSDRPQEFSVTVEGGRKTKELRPGPSAAQSGPLGPDRLAVLFFASSR